MPYEKCVFNEVAGFQVSTLLKVNFFTFTFLDFCQIFRNIYFKEHILIAAPAIYFFNLFLLSYKRVCKTVGLLLKLQNVLPRTSKLFIKNWNYFSMMLR